MELLAPDAFRTQLDINVVSQLALTQQLLPMIRQAKGRIVNIGSASGFLTFPFNGAYAASKHALVAVTEALRMELVPWKIHVCLIEPGPVKTPIWQKKGGASDQVDSELQGHAKELYGRAYEAAAEAAKAVEQIAVEADAVAAAVEQALTSPSPKLRYLVGNAGKRRWVQRILPQSTFENLIRKLMKLPQD